jgi:hypothetical protein
MPHETLDYRAPRPREPRPPLWSTTRGGILSLSAFCVALTVHLGICLIPIPASSGPRSAFEYHFMCLVPAAIAGLGIIAGATGIITDKYKTATVIALLLNAALAFALLLLDALQGVSDH